MTATLLTLTPAVRKAAKDVKVIEQRLRDEGAGWAPALQKARDSTMNLARVRDWRKPPPNE